MLLLLFLKLVKVFMKYILSLIIELLKKYFIIAYSEKEFISQGVTLEKFLWTDIYERITFHEREGMFFENPSLLSKRQKPTISILISMTLNLKIKNPWKLIHNTDLWGVSLSMTLITKTLNLRRTSYPQFTDFASEYTTLEFSHLNFEGDYDHTDKKNLGLLG